MTRKKSFEKVAIKKKNTFLKIYENFIEIDRYKKNPKVFHF